MPTPNFSELSEDARLAVFRASLGIISPAHLDLSLLPEEEVLKQIMRHQKTCLGENFKAYLLATLAKVAEEVIANMEICIAQGYPDQAVRVNKRRDPRIRPEGIFTLLDDLLREAYGVKKEVWALLKTQIDGLAPETDQLEKSSLFEERNRRWVAAWLATERAGKWTPREGKEGIAAWLRDVANPCNQHGSYKKLYAPHAEELLQEFSCPRCGQRVPEALFEKAEGMWDCCESCHVALSRRGDDWCPVCCMDTNDRQERSCQCL